jgi:hypothetical protein
MRLFSFVLWLAASSISLAQEAITTPIDPDLVDTEMTRVMYLIGPNDLKTSNYKNGFPSVFNLKLCDNCQIKPYQLKDQAELLLNEKPLTLKDLTITLIKKKFDVIQLGIDRSNKTISYLYLGGISELSAEEIAQEQSDEN